MISVYREDGYTDVKVWVFVVDSWEAMRPQHDVRRGEYAIAYEKPSALPSSGSLKSSTCMGLSPRVYSRSRADT